MSNERKDPWSVGAWMSTNPATVSPDTTARAAFVKMRTENYRHLLVKDGETLIGIVTDRDLRRPDITAEADGWNDYYQLDSDYTVADVMTREPDTVRPRDKLEKALATMNEKKIGALPVLDKTGSPIGILTTHDLLGAFHEALKEAGEVLRR